MAKKLGANVALRADSPNVLEEILKHGPITHSIECSGAEPSINLAIRATDNGGKVLLIGRSAKPTQNVPLFDAADKEIDLIGSFRYRNTYPKALALIAAGKVDVKPLITHYFPLDKVSEAFEQCETGRDGAIKVVIQVNKP
jgi:L-iditol 2-dehydrogenase